MRNLKQTLLAAVVLGVLVLGTAGIVLSQEQQPAGGAGNGSTLTNLTSAPAPLSPQSIPSAS